MGNGGSAASAKSVANPHLTLVSNYRSGHFESLKSATHRTLYIRSAFYGIWSLNIPNCLNPPSRSGQFCVYDKENQNAYIGYGIDRNGNALNDVWRLDVENNTWHQLRLSGDYIEPRSGARAFLYKDLIYVFGGFRDPNYFSNLHTIDIYTGKVTILQFDGIEPSPRSTPIMSIQNDKIYVWGGYYTGNFPTELNIFDIKYDSNNNSNNVHGTWRQVKQDITGRTAANCVLYKGMVYSYGGSRSPELLCIDLEKELCFSIKTKGAEPPPDILNAQMVLVENFAFFIGGRKEVEYTFIYVCDLERKWWFVFHVKPDGLTVTTSDGYVNEYGLFMVPCLHSFALFYRENKKELVMTLGAPLIDPPPISIFSIGIALGVLHLRDDMFDMLQLSI
ncbi:Kelch motif family protein [Tritrichomonas foetus]|uniref:Kelch motif family protein n=1 Tax=Tritrichomonas foetus TaxID=1144522 RepID=A0A1J4KVX8_9EUKA|nr:Kelch motif family protein [Tritrichomonas foetus]|eukprot:OHT15290.1 Kelch motif family protein [Tritrichomonas foetus]